MKKARALVPLLIALLIAMGTTAAGAADQRHFFARLSGGEEVGPVITEAEGGAKFRLSLDGTELDFRLKVQSIKNVVASHIHCGAMGVNGPVGVTLFSGGPVTLSGILSTGTITAPNAGNGCGWGSLDAVVAAMRTGDTYVNVHTLANPPGEIRGQID